MNAAQQMRKPSGATDGSALALTPDLCLHVNTACKGSQEGSIPRYFLVQTTAIDRTWERKQPPFLQKQQAKV